MADCHRQRQLINALYRKTLVFVNLMTNNCMFLGRVSSLHRSSAASRQDLCLHLVQPSSSEAKIFQETREEDELGGGEAMQRGADGKNLVLGPANGGDQIIFFLGSFDVY